MGCGCSRHKDEILYIGPALIRSRSEHGLLPIIIENEYVIRDELELKDVSLIEHQSPSKKLN